MAKSLNSTDAGALDFAPAILRAQHENPPPLPRTVLYIALALFGVMLAWACFGRLDIIAVAQGKLIPSSYVKIVQPADSGVLREILVGDGQEVKAGQVLLRMDTQVTDADQATVETDLMLRRLQLRRIEAELAGVPFTARPGDRADLIQQVTAQSLANRRAYESQLESEQAALAKAGQDLNGALDMESRLKQTVPIYLETEAAHRNLAKDGFISRLAMLDKTRERIEKEQELKAQPHQVASLKAPIEQSRKRLAQITSTYRQQLQNERSEANGQRLKLEQEAGKQAYCRTLLALDSPYLERDGKRFRVSAGMIVSAEVNLGSRTVMEYLLSPVQKVTHEAGREK